MLIDIHSYPIDPTGTTLSSPAINQALLDCANSGGGTVELPAGRYLCGTIDLQSHVTLHLHPGAIILGSEDIADYHGTERGCSWGWMGAPEALSDLNQKNPCPALIVADRKTHFGITGSGIIDGQRSFAHGYTEKKGRPFLIVLSECSYVTLRDVTLQNPGMFTVYGLNSCDMTISNVTILTANSANGDGLDFDGGKRISISDCHMDVGDDGIGLKTLTPDEPCEDFTISGCHIRSKHWGAVRIGPESAGAMRRINITNCCFYDSGDGLKFQLTQDADFEDFNISNITMQEVLRPIFFTKNRYNMSSLVKEIRPGTGAFRRVHLSNITALMRQDSVFPEMTVYAGNYISALPGDSIDDITLDHVHLIAPGGGSQEAANRVDDLGEMYDFWGMYPEHLTNLGEYPSAVMYIRHAKGIRLQNCIFEALTEDARAAVAAEDVKGLRVSDCEARGCGALLRVHGCEPLLMRDNVGEVLRFTEDQVTAWQAKAILSYVVDETMQTLADQFAAASAGTIVQEFEICLASNATAVRNGEVVFTAAADDALWAVIPRVTGNISIICNGKRLEVPSLPALYQVAVPVAVRLPKLRNGENRLCVQPMVQMKEQTVTLRLVKATSGK